jgi:hypothetical protein
MKYHYVTIEIIKKIVMPNIFEHIVELYFSYFGGKIINYCRHWKSLAIYLKTKYVSIILFILNTYYVSVIVLVLEGPLRDKYE